MYPKIGSAPVMDVLAYGQPVRTQGLNLLSAPGNDLVASTALAASGAQIVLFTTGRGTPTGNAIAPVLKVTANKRTYTHMEDNMDVDLSGIIEGNEDN